MEITVTGDSAMATAHGAKVTSVRWIQAHIIFPGDAIVSNVINRIAGVSGWLPRVLLR